MSRENVEVVRRALDAWNAGDPAVAAAVLDPDVAGAVHDHAAHEVLLLGMDARGAPLVGVVVAAIFIFLENVGPLTVEGLSQML